jgi:hypothetical protein
MKKLYLAALLILSCIASFAQHWNWVSTSASTETQMAHGIATDSWGNSYAAGYTAGQAVFGTALVDSGYYLSKYDAGGNAVWAMNIPGEWHNQETDAQGNLYITGRYSGTVSLGAYTFTSAGTNDILLAKLDPAGNVLWAKTYGGQGQDNVHAIAIDNSGNIILTGQFSQTAIFDNVMLSDQTFSLHFFLLKTDPAGTLQWVTKGNYMQIQGDFLAIDDDNNIYVSGNYSDTCYYCNGNYVAKYDPSGNVLLMNTSFGMYESIHGLHADSDQNIYIIYNTGSHYLYHPFLAKYDPVMTNKLWERDLSSGYYGWWLSNDISFDDQDNIYLAGGFGGQYMYADTMTIEGHFLQRERGVDLLFAKCDPQGNIQWMMTVPGTSNEHSTSIRLNNNNELYVTGTINYGGNAGQIDTVAFGTHTVISDGSWSEMFLARLDMNTALSNVSIASEDEDISVYPNPSNGNFTISIDAKENVSIYVYDVLGNRVKEISNAVAINPIDLSGNSAGVYTVQLWSSDKKVTRKIIKR